MDGIFGVGLPEMLIIALALFVVGGPENTAKWARQLGKWVREARLAWSQMMADMEKELGPEGKEIMDAARELGQGARDLRTMAPARRMVGETMRQLEASVELDERGGKEAPQTPATPPPPPAAPSANGKGDERYRAWLPPDEQQ